MRGNGQPHEHREPRDSDRRIDRHPLPGTEARVQRRAGSHAVILTGTAGQPYRSQDGSRVSVARPTTDPARGAHPGRWRKDTTVSDSYRGATKGELLGAPLARHVAATSASPARRGAARLGGGAMTMP